MRARAHVYEEFTVCNGSATNAEGQVKAGFHDVGDLVCFHRELIRKGEQVGAVLGVLPPTEARPQPGRLSNA